MAVTYHGTTFNSVDCNQTRLITSDIIRCFVEA